jgi:hypothetical protein
MAHEPDTIHIADDSELARLLEHVDSTALRLETNGVVYRVVREDNAWAGYDPAKVRTATRATAGSWADLDTDALIADLYRAREEGSRPADRPQCSICLTPIGRSMLLLADVARITLVLVTDERS